MLKLLKMLFCGHEMSRNLFAEKNLTLHRSRHFYECKKCGKRKYVD